MVIVCQSYTYPRPVTAKEATVSPNSPHDERLRVRVVAHTHWDREWYWSAGKTRQRLVGLVDALLDSDAKAAFPFLLDGQAITVTDYLAVRPDREPQILALLRDGKIEVGPWYVLADNLIPSGEAIVRNLQAGRRLLERFSSKTPPVAYCPDSFGHPAAMPLIAQGFGLSTAVVWRGYGGDSFPAGDTFVWEWNDDSSIVTWHLPRDGYESGSKLPVSAEAARLRWQEISREIVNRAATNVVLLANGADHHALQPDITAAINALQNAAGSSAIVVRSSLSEFAYDLVGCAQQIAPPVVRGELRDSYGYAWTLQGTFGTRAQDKRTNAQLERGLVHDTEPMCALALLRSEHKATKADGTLSPAQYRYLLAFAWETLLQTHPHDTLCGCSIDDVAFAMRERQRDVASQIDAIADDALKSVLNYDTVGARAQSVVAQNAPVVVRNRCARARSGVARIRIVDTIADVPVGPGSGSHMSSHVTYTQMSAENQKNGAVKYGFKRRESPQHYPDNDLVSIRDVLAYVNDVPALGIKVQNYSQLFSQSPDGHQVQSVKAASKDGAFSIDNGHIRIDVSLKGLTLHVGSRTINDFLALEYQIDVGDTYTPSIQGTAERFVISDVYLGMCNELVGEIVVEASYNDMVHSAVFISLHAGSTYATVNVKGNNNSNDCRIRLRFATDVMNPVVHADAAFGPVVRYSSHANNAHQRVDSNSGMSYQDQIGSNKDDSNLEQRLPGMPLHRWVCATSLERGVTVISDGLSDCEVGDSSIHITLVRAIGELSRNNLPERPGHAGWPASVPNAQSHGEFGGTFAILVHGPWNDDILHDIECAADDVLLPLEGESFRDAELVEQTIEGVALEGRALRLQAFMPAQSGDGVVARIVNLSDSHNRGTLRLPAVTTPAYYETREVRLDETPLNEWNKVVGAIHLDLKPRAALTVQLRACR